MDSEDERLEPEKLNTNVSGEPDVFISYSTKNTDVADKVVRHLEQNGIRCWYAPRNISPGQEWVSAINKALREAKVFILIYTKESNASRQVMNEVALAFNGEKTIVPLRLSEEPMSDEIAYYLTRVHWLDATHSSTEDSLEALRSQVALILTNSVAMRETSAASLQPATRGNRASGKKIRSALIGIGVAVTVIACVFLGILALKDNGSASGTEIVKETEKTAEKEPEKTTGKEKNPEPEEVPDSVPLGEDDDPDVLKAAQEEAIALAEKYISAREFDKAFPYVKWLAESIDTDPKWYLYWGRMCLYGFGTEVDKPEAVLHLSRAHDRGAELNSYELYELACAYWNGIRIDGQIVIDAKKGFELMKTSAENGDCVDSIYMLGVMYYSGSGTDIDYEKALEWLGAALDTELISESDADFCHSAINAMVHNHYVSEEAAAKWLQ